MAYFDTRNYVIVAWEYGDVVEKATAVLMTLGVKVPRILLRALRSRSGGYLIGVAWALLWFMSPRLVPTDARAVDALQLKTAEKGIMA